MTISLCMIVKNEEEVLGRCLESVAALVEEIVIVDTGSTDRTKEIAAVYTDRIYDFAWVEDFSAARNYAFSWASCDYCLWLDADDILTAEAGEALLELKRTLPEDVTMVMLPYHTGFDAQGNVTFSYSRERLIKNHEGLWWVGAVHEVIPPAGKIVYGTCAVTHRKLRTADPARNLRIFEAQLQRGERLDARQQFYYGRELYYQKRYADALGVLEAFLETAEGWVENKIDACCHCAYCCYELGREEEALQALLRTLAFDLPRAEACCEIGKHFFDRELWRQAAFWYTLATTCHRDDSRGGFAAPECYGYLPCIQLCVCYSRLGDEKKAIRFNELAAAFKPESEAVGYNRAYFAKNVADTVEG